MKTSHKIHLIVISLMIAMTISVIAAGTMIISELAYNFQNQVLVSELEKTRQAVFETLNRTGLQAAVRMAARLQTALRENPPRMATSHVFIIEAPDRVVFHQDCRPGEIIRWDQTEDLFRKGDGNAEYLYRGTPHYAVFTTIHPINWLIGISISKDEMFEKTKEYLLRICLIAAAIVLTGVFVVSLFVDRFVRHIQKALDCIKQIEKGDLNASIHPITAKDEIGRLQTGINAMSAKIRERTIERQKAEDEIRNLNETLEQRVAQRTAALKESSGQLRRLAVELSEAEDRERRNIASILHDDFQQNLAYVKLELDMLKKETDAYTRKKLALLAKLIGENIQKSRDLSYSLNPPALSCGSFSEAMGFLVGEVQDKHGLNVKLRAQTYAGPRSQVLRAFLYRAAKELLVNIAKHAGVDSAEMEVRSENDRIVLRIRDFGKGFDYEAVKSGQGMGSGFGLYNIEDRVAFLGGSMSIRSSPGKGCTVFLTVPEPEQSQAEKQTPQAG